ncbi:hypothetical protein BDW62DRAFT_220667 [Aspergillus aurantiobrunneus]
MKPQNKPRIFMTMQPRGKNSLGENRIRLGYSAYHWGILISPKHPTPSEQHTHFDVTDSIYIDPLTGEGKENWRFRERSSSDPAIAWKGVEGENCVSWTKEAVGVLRDMGVLEEGFDLNGLMDAALEFADGCLVKGEMGRILDYIGRGGID